MTKRNNKFNKTSVNMDNASYSSYLIENQKLLHYENLLINRLDSIKLYYDDKFKFFRVSSIVSIIITILGYTSDVIGIKLLKLINLNEVIAYGIFAIPSTLLLISTIRFHNKIKSLNIEFFKNPFYQNKLFYSFIIKKHKKELPDEINFFEHFFLGNEITVIFNKDDLNFYIDSYFSKKFKINDINLSMFLTEVIIARGIIKKVIKVVNIGEIDEYNFIINRHNAMFVQDSMLNNE